MSCKTPRAEGGACVGAVAAHEPVTITNAIIAPVVSVDARFRDEISKGLLDQVEREDWAAFVPDDGTTRRQGARVDLANGGWHSASWTRACTAAQLEKRDGEVLRQLARDLTRTDKQSPDDGFTCTRDTCSAWFGEMGFNGDLVFARAGKAVRLVAVRDQEAGIQDDVQ